MKMNANLVRRLRSGVCTMDACVDHSYADFRNTRIPVCEDVLLCGLYRSAPPCPSRIIPALSVAGIIPRYVTIWIH